MISFNLADIDMKRGRVRSTLFLLMIFFSFTSNASEAVCEFLVNLSQEEKNNFFENNYENFYTPSYYHDSNPEGVFIFENSPYIVEHNRNNLAEIQIISQVTNDEKKLLCLFSNETKFELIADISSPICPFLSESDEQPDYQIPESWTGLNQPFNMRGDDTLIGVAKFDYNNDGSLENIVFYRSDRPPYSIDIYLLIDDQKNEVLGRVSPPGKGGRKERFVFYNGTTYVESKADLRSQPDKYFYKISESTEELVCDYDTKLETNYRDIEPRVQFQSPAYFERYEAALSSLNR